MVANRYQRAGRAAGWLLMATLALIVLAYAVIMLVTRAFPEQLQPSFQAHSLAISVHIGGSLLTLALGPFQFVARLRGRYPALHRWMGRAYLVSVLVGGLGGLYMAMFSSGGMVAHLGFAGLALAWLLSGAIAYRAIRARRIAEHRRWMVRNFAATFAAVTLRLWMPLLIIAAHLPFSVAYPLVAWLAWVPNLVLAELGIRYLARRGQPQPHARLSGGASL